MPVKYGTYPTVTDCIKRYVVYHVMQMALESNPLVARLDEVLLARGFSARSWSLAAGLSETYVKVQRTRAAASSSYVLPEKMAEQLARAANVRTEWLRFGRGPRDAKEPDPPPPVAVCFPDVDVALLDAFKAGSYTSEDFLEAQRLLRQHSFDGVNRTRVGGVARRLLEAVTAIRREGGKPSLESVAWRLAAETKPTGT